MNYSANASDFSNARAFGDDAGYGSTSATFSSVLLRVAGTFGGGITLTALLAIVAHH